jgi:hypothetical protein
VIRVSISDQSVPIIDQSYRPVSLTGPVQIYHSLATARLCVRVCGVRGVGWYCGRLCQCVLWLCKRVINSSRAVDGVCALCAPTDHCLSVQSGSVLHGPACRAYKWSRYTADGSHLALGSLREVTTELDQSDTTHQSEHSTLYTTDHRLCTHTNPERLENSCCMLCLLCSTPGYVRYG